MGFAWLCLLWALNTAPSDDCEPCWLHDFGIGECHGCGQ